MKKSLRSQIFKITFLAIAILMYSCDEAEKRNTPQEISQDWQQFKNDNFRSGNASIELDLASLGEDWKYNAPQMPVPAWYGPAKEDTYARSGPLPSMRDYDLSYYPIIAGTKLYYGSTSDNAIHCLDTKTGIEEWTYTTGGPIRVAPVFYEGRLYFGSDDGFAYCIKASNGKLVWKYSPVKKQPKKLMNNNALISFWPIRTGILIEDNIAYFGASLLPWKDSYFCAIDIKSGTPKRKGTYIKKYDHTNLQGDETLTFEGAMASTGTKIIQPRGRISPIFINKKDGTIKGQIAGTGGCFVLITPEKNVVHPNNTRAKGISETIGDFAEAKAAKENKNAEYMSFKGGKEMVVAGDFSYILTDNAISAYNRKTKKILWLKRHYNGHRIIVSGDVLYIGSTDAVYAVSTKNGYPLWKASVKGAVYALAVADNALFASTGEGKIYCFRSGKGANALLAENKDKSPEIEKEVRQSKEIEVANLQFSAGPFVKTVGTNSVEIHFITDEAIAAEVSWGDITGRAITKENAPTKDHKIVIDNVRKDFIYQYQIIAGNNKTPVFEFDNFFNFETERESTSEVLEKNGLVSRIETLYTKGKGIAIVLGLENKNQALEIASIKGVKVMLFDDSESKVQELREELQKEGIYGGQISVHYADNLEELPVTGDIANVVMVNNTSNSSADEVIRLIKPEGVAILNNKGDYENWLNASTSMWQVNHSNKDGFNVLIKAPYETAGKWTHQYGLADNTAYGGESLWGSTDTDDFEIQWMGRPGPRFQTDRSGRKPSPLAVDGKMFVQGRERIIAVDAYNGQVLWSKEIPKLSRMNLVRDCSNWVADDDFIYLAHKRNLLKINNENGDIANIIPVENKGNDWGYISIEDDLIIGSSVPKGSGYTNYHGGEGWYDGQSGPLTDKVVSTSLFAKEKIEGKTIWEYKKSSTYIINPTITISKNQIRFVESRNRNFKLSVDKRADPSIFKDLYMVALNPKTGAVILEKKLDNVPGVTTYFMTASEDRNVILASNAGMYYIYNYDATTGDLVWEKEQQWFSGDHGGHFSRPAIVNNRLIIKPAMYKLDTGELLEEQVPKAGHGCASYALSEQSVFYRGGSVTQFNFDTNKFSQWERLRPDCWISTIPAQGLVLSPEAGGGCSCGNWLETSMVFTPKSRAPISFIYEFQKFVDNVSVEIKSRDKNNKNIYYTLDGSEPTKTSKQYLEPINITDNTELKAVIYVKKKNDEDVAYVRTKSFSRAHPEPTIVETPQLIDGSWEFTIERGGSSGEIHYTTDGTTPTIKSLKFENPINFSDKVLVKAKTFWKLDSGTVESRETSFEVLTPKLIESVEAEVQTGISRSFYKGNEKSNDFVKLDEVAPTKTEVVNTINSEPYKEEKMFALRFNGYVNIPVDGVYTISSVSSKSFDFVSLHGKVEIKSRGRNEVSSQFALKKGLHPIMIDHYVAVGPSDYDLQIEGPKMEKQSIATNLLSH